MDCNEFLNSLDKYFEKDCPPGLKTAIEEHAAVCKTCITDFNRIKLYFQRIQELSPGITPPANIIDEIIAEISQITPRTIQTEAKTRERAQNKQELAPVKPVKISKPEPKPEKVQKTGASGHLTLFYIAIICLLLLLGYTLVKFYIK